MNYSGPSPVAMYAREREQQQSYDEAREAFEWLLDRVDAQGLKYELVDWFGDGGVTDYAPIFKALVAARDAGVEEARALLADWAHQYAEMRL